MKTKLYVLGNGFDLEHDLPTRYKDFKSYLEIHNKEFLNKLASVYDVFMVEDHYIEDDYTNPWPKEYFFDNSEKWWQDFENSLGNGEEFEYNFRIMAENMIDNMRDDDGDPMPDIESTLETEFEKNYSFMERLNDNVLDWIRSIEVDKANKRTDRFSKNDAYYLVFNYTNTLEKVYEVDRSDICYIHGSAGEGRVIMGHGNKEALYTAEENYKIKKNDKYNSMNNEAEIDWAIYSFYKASFKDTENIIEENEYYFSKYGNVDEVHILGHSLGEVDWPYFAEIKRNIKPKAKWYFYEHCEEGEADARRQKEFENRKCMLVESFGIDPDCVHILDAKEFWNTK
ncbi:bacteriophage abortive infection AbiH family protein [Butyrivibrio sp. VCD2006]|uniref:bacteriophage abortive infection AbiH family protein n=1 Tax=Butyrivibrio sp. VCD2006 TaxID=1280664 RepID=UPI000400193B|nr:bacteriophage abortive infection AbiH family protein [Butyrivibrio sp. VCD2006]